MRTTLKPWSVMAATVGLLVTITLLPIASATSVHADQPPPLPNEEAVDAALDGPSLHNPNFDNGYWYEFHLRYQDAYPTGAWVPAGTDMHDLVQDWRLWFLDGTDIVNVDPLRISPDDEVVKIRSFSWSGKDHQVAGLYQPIVGTTPCMNYRFQILGQSELNEPDDWLDSIRVIIDRVGWHPDSANDPAIHTFPSTMVWGAASQQSGAYVPLEVTAEALNTQIAVYTYANAWGSKSHKIYWNTGSFEEIAPGDLLANPNSPPGSGGRFSSGPTVVAGRTSATVSWNTTLDTLGQVYYRLVWGPQEPNDPPPATLTERTYLPVMGRVDLTPSWLSSEVGTSSQTSHSMIISDLEPGSTYEVFVAARGLAGSACQTWASGKVSFDTTTR